VPRLPSKNIVGPRIAKARQLATPPLTQDQLAGRLARHSVLLDRAAIAKIETNRRRVFDFELKALAKALRVSVDWLLGIEA
jgi:HTH-type transcriptional regulator, cell division transcriptional repressor